MTKWRVSIGEAIRRVSIGEAIRRVSIGQAIRRVSIGERNQESVDWRAHRAVENTLHRLLHERLLDHLGQKVRDALVWVTELSEGALLGGRHRRVSTAFVDRGNEGGPRDPSQVGGLGAVRLEENRVVVLRHVRKREPTLLGTRDEEDVLALTAGEVDLARGRVGEESPE